VGKVNSLVDDEFRRKENESRRSNAKDEALREAIYFCRRLSEGHLKRTVDTNWPEVENYDLPSKSDKE